MDLLNKESFDDYLIKRYPYVWSLKILDFLGVFLVVILLFALAHYVFVDELLKKSHFDFEFLNILIIGVALFALLIILPYWLFSRIHNDRIYSPDISVFSEYQRLLMVMVLYTLIAFVFVFYVRFYYKHTSLLIENYENEINSLNSGFTPAFNNLIALSDSMLGLSAVDLQNGEFDAYFKQVSAELDDIRSVSLRLVNDSSLLSREIAFYTRNYTAVFEIPNGNMNIGNAVNTILEDSVVSDQEYANFVNTIQAYKEINAESGNLFVEFVRSFNLGENHEYAKSYLFAHKIGDSEGFASNSPMYLLNNYLVKLFFWCLFFAALIDRANFESQNEHRVSIDYVVLAVPNIFTILLIYQPSGLLEIFSDNALADISVGSVLGYGSFVILVYILGRGILVMIRLNNGGFVYVDRARLGQISAFVCAVPTTIFLGVSVVFDPGQLTWSNIGVACLLSFLITPLLIRKLRFYSSYPIA